MNRTRPHGVYFAMMPLVYVRLRDGAVRDAVTGTRFPERVPPARLDEIRRRAWYEDRWR